MRYGSFVLSFVADFVHKGVSAFVFAFDIYLMFLFASSYGFGEKAGPGVWEV